MVVLSDEWADIGADTDREGWWKRIQQSVMSQSDRGIDSKFRAYLKDVGISAASCQRNNKRAQDIRKRKLLKRATGESTESGDKVVGPAEALNTVRRSTDKNSPFLPFASRSCI